MLTRPPVEVRAMLMEVTCRCGWTIRGSEADVIAGLQEHARSTHDRELSADEVRAVWHVVDDPAAPGG
jgi:predicted small metal-binding protein